MATIAYYIKNLFASDGIWRKNRADKGKNYTEKTLEYKRRLVKNYVIPLWGEYDPRDLDSKIIDDTLKGLVAVKTSKWLSGVTKNKILSILSALYINLIFVPYFTPFYTYLFLNGIMRYSLIPFSSFFWLPPGHQRFPVYR
jgi:hypothetical protein